MATKPDTATKRRRIFWKAKEDAAVQKEVLRLYQENPTMLVADLWAAGQLVLPTERHRPMSGPVHAWFSKLIHKRTPNKAAAVKAVTPKAAAPAPLPPPAPEPIPESAAPVSAPNPRDLVIDSIADTVVELITRIVLDERMRAALHLLMLPATPGPTIAPAKVGAPYETPHSPFPKANGAAGIRKPRVVIVGMKGHQPEEIRSSYGDKLNLAFWASHESSDKLRDMTSHCDVAIGMVNFISHPSEQIAKSRAAKYLPVAGGVGAIKDALHKLVQPGTQ